MSTTTPTLMENALPSTTLAVFLATPGSRSSSSMVRGTSPPNSWTIIDIAPWIDLDLLRKNPNDRTYGSSFCGVVFVKSAGAANASNSLGVALFTATSVAWADRIVAINSWQGLE